MSFFVSVAAIIVLACLTGIAIARKERQSGRFQLLKPMRHEAYPKDAWESVYFGDQPDTRPVKVTADIEYVDKEGQFTKRQISISQFCEWEGGYAIHAHCHMREENRTFLTRRIKSFIDLRTGDKVIDIGAFLRKEYDASGAGRLEQAVTQLADCLRVLTFVARADERVMAAEVDLIIKFVKDYASVNLEDVTREQFEDSIRAFSTGKMEFRRILRALVSSKKIPGMSEVCAYADRIAGTRKSANEFLDAAMKVIENESRKPKC